ncbi:MAG: exodeoxyribonuclease VII small subunit, partial [Thermomicrobiales bacterium]
TATTSASFEETLLALQQIVEDLEAGNLPLAETVRKFEQGSRLADQARRQLAEAELRVTVLTEQMQAEDFGGWDDDSGSESAPF